MEIEPQTRRYFLALSFEGTAYHGWQVQPNAVTVQSVLESALQMLLRQPVSLTGAGRTDTGVHARSYTAHFDYIANPLDPQQLIYKLNSILPADIAVHSLNEVSSEAHARYSALWREYEYIICTQKDPFLINKSWRMERELNLDAMQQAASLLLEFQDFECFSKSNTQVNNYLCQIMEAHWRKEGHQLIFSIRANRFLRNMVRAIVGTLTDVGLGKITLNDLVKIIESKNRSKAGYSVPGCGLYFMGAAYPPEIFT